jgi:outer membrane biosynthesis protein TonB
MLPDIRAVIAAIAAAIGLLMISFGLVATFRVAQDSRAASLQADLAQRGRASPPEHRPISIIETPGPTLAVTAPVAPAQPVSTEPEPADATLAPDIPTVAATEPAPENPENKEAAPVMAAAPAETEAPALPAPPLAIGGPSPEEVAQAEAEHQAAERAKIKKAAAKRAKKARAARIARERKTAARRAAQARAKAQQQQLQTNSFNSAGTFNNAPFGSSFGGFENSTRRP